MTKVCDIFNPVFGQSAWLVRRGYGTSLTMEFGQPRLVIRHPRTVSGNVSDRVKRNFQKRRVTIVGQWHFWIQFCNWVLTTSSACISSNEPDTEKIDSCLDELDGQILVTVNEDATSASCTFHFDLGASLVLSPTADTAVGDQWTINYLDQSIFAYQSNGTIGQDVPPAEQ